MNWILFLDLTVPETYGKVLDGEMIPLINLSY